LTFEREVRGHTLETIEAKDRTACLVLVDEVKINMYINIKIIKSEPDFEGVVYSR
jgi:hypothetical protein